MEKISAYGLICISIVSLFNVYSAAEFVKADIVDKECVDLDFTAFNVLSLITCAAMCKMSGQCTHFLYTNREQKCDGCKLDNVTSNASLEPGSTELYSTELVLYILRENKPCLSFRYLGCYGPCYNDEVNCYGTHDLQSLSGGNLNLTANMCEEHCFTYTRMALFEVQGQMCICSHLGLTEYTLETLCSCELTALECLQLPLATVFTYC